MHEYKPFYRRKLPHFHIPGSTLFVTFRLANTIPRTIVNNYKVQKRAIDDQLTRLVKTTAEGEVDDMRSEQLREFHRTWFKKYEDILHREETGPTWLKKPEIASLIYDSFIHRDRKDFDLKAFCIMANHVHSVFRPLLSHASIDVVQEPKGIRLETIDPTVGVIMKSLKGYTARMSNRMLGRTGQFWEVESYDHQVRDEAEFYRIVRYVLQNPVKAGTVENWRDWRWTYLSEELQPYF